ncbi:MAG: hypothetical protein NTZ30_03240 [Planctomycetota bacterium]|nr:hypothetical protein [Planctomycetota bacterium]
MFFSKSNINPIFMSILPIVMLVGCGSGDKPSAITTDPTIISLDKLGGAYIRGTPPPKTKAELLAIFKSCNHPKELLISPSDGQEFIIVYGVELKGLKVTGAQLPIVAFEKTGKDGKRYALRGMNTVVQLTEAELKSSVFPEGYKFPF